MEILAIILIILLLISNSETSSLKNKNKELTNKYDELHEENLKLRKEIREEKNRNFLLQSLINKK